MELWKNMNQYILIEKLGAKKSSKKSKKMTNPVNCVESVASEGWIRGGVPSRELTRDVDYFNKHTEFQYV